MIVRSLRRSALVLVVPALISWSVALPFASASSEIRAEVSFDPGGVSIEIDASKLPRVILRAVPEAVSTLRGIEAMTYLALPAGTAPVQVHVTGLESETLTGLAGELPASRLGQLPVSGSSVGEGAGTGWMRGVQLQAVRLLPIFRDTSTGELKIWSRVEIVVDTEPSPIPAGIWRPERKGTASEVSFNDVLRSMVANPGDVEAVLPRLKASALAPNSFSGDAFSPLFRPSVDGSGVDYVIITTDALAPAFERLRDWRLKTGVSTAIRTIEWIKSQYTEGVDLPDRIRRFIQDAASRWGTQYVLLGGDFDRVPMRYGHNTYYGGEDIPTDLYYQCLDRNWNENGNQLFGEGAAPGNGLSPDNVDFFPEVFLGRIPCSTVSGVNAVLDKTFQYERTPPPTPDYIPTYLALAEVLQPINWNPGDTVVFDGTFFTEQVISRLPNGFRAARLYENHTDPRWSASAIPLTRDTAIDSINAGFGIVHHVGHGFRNNLSVGLGGLEIIREDADAFTNSTEPFLFFGINCNSASLDFDSIAEHFLCNPGGGCFSYLGSTRFDFPGSDDPYQNEFFRLLFLGTPVAQAHALAKTLSIPNAFVDNAARWHQMSLVSLGEPLVRFRSAAPFVPVVIHPSSLTLGAPVGVTVMKSGAALEGARVTLYKAGDVFSTGLTDAAGAVSLACPADEAGLVSLTVTATNAIPYSVDIPVSAPPLAFVSITGLRIDDSISGNGDGRLDAGETADLHFKVTNSGGAAAEGLTLTYSTADPAVSVVHAVMDVASLAPGEADSISVTQTVRVSASPTVTRALDAPGQVLLAWTGLSRVESFGLRVGGGSLWVQSQTFRDDPGGPGENGLVAAGETIEVTPELMNRGISRLDAVTIRLESTDNRVTILNGTASLGTLDAGETAAINPPLSFSLSDSAAVSAIRLVIDSSVGVLRDETLDLVPPVKANTPEGFSKPTSIILSWNPKFDEDLRGYIVQRSTAESGPFERVNPVADNPMGFFEDDGLAALTRYYYRVAPQDKAGNTGPMSDVSTFITSYASLENWPLVRNAGSPSSPVVHDLNGDGTPEVIAGGQEIYAVHADGSEYFDGDNDSRSLGILTTTGGATFWGTPAVADVDNDGILEIVGAGWTDGNLYVFGVDGAIQPGWPRTLGAREGQPAAALPWSSPLLADVDGDGDLEIFLCADHYLYGFHHDGTEIRDGDGNPATIGVFQDLGGGFNYGSPAGADFDHDGKPDIVVGTRTGVLWLLKGDGTVLFTKNFSTMQSTNITGSPAIADLDQDGELEMIFPVRNLLEVHAVNRFGVSPPGWPVRISINQDLDASPTVAKLDQDIYPDVVMAGGGGRIGLWHGQNGESFPNFPVDISNIEPGQQFIVRGTPCLGDITGDGIPDIVVGTQTASVYAVSIAGQVIPGFPLKALDNIEGGPLLWDIDGDGHTNLLFGSFDKRIYAYDTPGIFAADGHTCPWPMFRHDQRNTGYVETSYATPVEPSLARFNARSVVGGVELTWQASGDLPAFIGWHLYRAELPGGAEERLTELPLAPRTPLNTHVDRTARPGARYRYVVAGLGRDGSETRFAGIPFDVPAGSPAVPFLESAPNPFRESTAITFAVTGPGETARPVRLDVFDVQGRPVRTLIDTPMAPGTYTITWDGRSGLGRAALAGVYFYRLSTGPETLTRKLTIVR